MKDLSLRLPDPLFDELQEEANKEGIQPEEIIEIALQTFLNSKKQESMSPLMKTALEFAGSLEGSPDLSTNPKYMEGFGT